MLLMQRRNEALSGGASNKQKARRLETALAGGIVAVRLLSGRFGRRSLEAEFARAGVPFPGAPPYSLSDWATERASRTAAKLAWSWMALADGTRVKGVAEKTTPTGFLRSRIGIIGASESSDAFNDSRREAAAIYAPEMLRRWDATLDERVCPVCARAHGTTVQVSEDFPEGEPGAVHPSCRCTWQLIRLEEYKSMALPWALRDARRGISLHP
jgi:hypothetical protein